MNLAVQGLDVGRILIVPFGGQPNGWVFLDFGVRGVAHLMRASQRSRMPVELSR